MKHIDSVLKKTKSPATRNSWFVTNERIREELKVESVKEVIERAAVRYHTRLGAHPNPLAQQVFGTTPAGDKS